MEWVETTGRSLDEAKDLALDQLGVDESDAEFVVVSEPRPGLFGRLRGEARVRARVRPTQPRPKRPGRSRSGTGERRGPRQGSGSQRSRGGAGEEGGAEKSGASRRSGTGGAAAASGADGTPAASTRSGTSGEDGARTGGRRRRRGGRGRGGGGAGGARPAAAPGASTTVGTEGGAGARSVKEPRALKEEAVVEELTLDEQGDAARRFVEGLLQEMGFEAEVTTTVLDPETAEVRVTGEGLGSLVGPGGATLAALQEVTRTHLQRETGGRTERILIDVAGYRAKRAEALRRFASQVAEEVIASGASRALEPMSPADRKVVHDAINEIAGVETRSEGEDQQRHIVLVPTAGQGEAAAPAAVGAEGDAGAE